MLNSFLKNISHLNVTFRQAVDRLCDHVHGRHVLAGELGNGKNYEIIPGHCIPGQRQGGIEKRPGQPAPGTQ